MDHQANISYHFYHFISYINIIIVIIIVANIIVIIIIIIIINIILFIYFYFFLLCLRSWGHLVDFEWKTNVEKRFRNGWMGCRMNGWVVGWMDEWLDVVQANIHTNDGQHDNKWVSDLYVGQVEGLNPRDVVGI